jgi:hypothetical protein
MQVFHKSRGVQISEVLELTKRYLPYEALYLLIVTVEVEATFSPPQPLT